MILVIFLQNIVKIDIIWLKFVWFNKFKYSIGLYIHSLELGRLKELYNGIKGQKNNSINNKIKAIIAK